MMRNFLNASYLILVTSKVLAHGTWGTFFSVSIFNSVSLDCTGNDSRLGEPDVIWYSSEVHNLLLYVPRNCMIHAATCSLLDQCQQWIPQSSRSSE